ncbi:hypothetical protein RSOL_104420 [Rhizoctonia solani AG-3 Rhs1AP]|uniref:Uncharacterized protein n=2 Tax=Rhizoctonia solani AG-3 TaxID=1086053 RepID=A0A074RHE7_9AGAM|nr:hypothetical protein RSOL_104420 [Rhizoctonia solani AG-3 Rhs1AP]KEP46546.1 hypothetical protein V565_193310 [Rhizoctonia solani 123E]
MIDSGMPRSMTIEVTSVLGCTGHVTCQTDSTATSCHHHSTTAQLLGLVATPLLVMTRIPIPKKKTTKNGLSGGSSSVTGCQWQTSTTINHESNKIQTNMYIVDSSPHPNLQALRQQLGCQVPCSRRVRPSPQSSSGQASRQRGKRSRAESMQEEEGIDEDQVGSPNDPSGPRR